MQIQWLEAFIAVAEELHFGRAAERLRMAQSPLSQTIRKLERDIGTPLFERSTRSVSLTAAGHSLLPHAHRVMEDLEIARAATRSSSGQVFGRLSIGFTGVLNHLSLPPLTRALRQRHPDIELNLVGRVMTRDAVTQLTNGSLDLAFVGLPVESTQVRTRLIAREPFGVVLPEDHPFAERAEIDLIELENEGFISTPLSAGSSLQESAMRACVDAGFRPHIVQEITDPYMIMMLVAAGVGVALMTSGIADMTPPGATYVPLGGQQTFMNHAVSWPTHRSSAALEAALAVAEDVLPTPDSEPDRPRTD